MEVYEKTLNSKNRRKTFFIICFISLINSLQLCPYSIIQSNKPSNFNIRISNHIENITIQNDSDFLIYSTKGNGSYENPYYIENKIIDSYKSAFGIKINNVTKYFLILNCTIKNTLSGVIFDNVSTGSMLNNSIFNISNIAIIMHNSKNCEILNNRFQDINYGLLLNHSSDLIIKENQIINSNTSITLFFSSYIHIESNIIESSSFIAMLLNSSIRNEIINNYFINNNIAIYLYNSNMSLFLLNDGENIMHEIILINSYNNTFSYNFLSINDNLSENNEEEINYISILLIFFMFLATILFNIYIIEKKYKIKGTNDEGRISSQYIRNVKK